MTKRIAIIVVAILSFAAIELIASEKEVQLKDVPPAVQAAVKAETKGDTITAVIEESDHGKVSYEVETTRAGKTRDLVFDTAGALVEVEEEIALEATPPAVRTALLAHGKVTKVEATTKGAVVTYEAQVEKNGKRTEIEVGADGRRTNAEAADAVGDALVETRGQPPAVRRQ